MVIVELTCGHIMEISEEPRLDEVCPECRDHKCIVNVWKEHWHSVCRQCAYHGHHGYSRKYCETAVQTHIRMTGHITVSLFYADPPERIRTVVRERHATKVSAIRSAEPLLPPF